MNDMKIGDFFYYDETPESTNRKVLVYGESKSGKTYLGGTFPSPVIFDTDNSLSGLPADRRHVPIVRYRIGNTNGRKWTQCVNAVESPFQPFETIQQFLINFKDKTGPFVNGIELKTVMIDSLTSLGELFLYQAMVDTVIGKSGKSIDGYKNPLTEKPSYDEYNTVKNMFGVLFNILEDINAHIYVTAGVKMDEDSVTKAIHGADPDIVGQTRKRLGHRFDSVLYMEGKNGTHYAHTTAYSLYKAGIRGWTGEKKVENPTFEKLFGKGV